MSKLKAEVVEIRAEGEMRLNEKIKELNQMQR